MLRKEAQTGKINDLAHIRTEHCLADCLTKHMKPTNLVTAVQCGILPEVDFHPPFRELRTQMAYLTRWITRNLDEAKEITWFLGTKVQDILSSYFSERHACRVTFQDSSPLLR